MQYSLTAIQVLQLQSWRRNIPTDEYHFPELQIMNPKTRCRRCKCDISFPPTSRLSDSRYYGSCSSVLSEAARKYFYGKRLRIRLLVCCGLTCGFLFTRVSFARRLLVPRYPVPQDDHMVAGDMSPRCTSFSSWQSETSSPAPSHNVILVVRSYRLFFHTNGRSSGF